MKSLIKACEALKQFLLILRADTNSGILNDKGKCQGIIDPVKNLYLEGNGSLLRILYSIIQNIDQHSAQAHLISKQLSRHLLICFHDESKSLFLCLLGDDQRYIIQQIGNIIISRNDLHLPGFNLGDIKDIIDNCQKITGCQTDIFNILSDLLADLLFQGKLRESDNGVHRRSDLMRHIGQEGRLCLIRILCILDRLLQLGNIFQSLGNIRHSNNISDHIRIIIKDLADGNITMYPIIITHYIHIFLLVTQKIHFINLC